jgi:hypothetical protein
MDEPMNAQLGSLDGLGHWTVGEDELWADEELDNDSPDWKMKVWIEEDPDEY